MIAFELDSICKVKKTMSQHTYFQILQANLCQMIVMFHFNPSKVIF